VQIIGGIVLGPGALGAVFPDYYATIFRPEVISALNGIAWWGVMLFVWLAGLELDLSEAWRQRRETGITSGLALVVPLVLGSLAALVLVQRPGWVGPGGAAWQTVLGLGMSCAVTALPILLMFLSNLDLMRHPLGQRILRYASLDDIAIWVVLALILMDVQQLSLQLGFALFFALLAEPMRRLIPRLREADRWAAGLIWMVGCGLFADRAGLHYMVGAFLAGAVLDGKWFGHDRMAAFRDMLLLALMPIFFLSTGLRTAWDMGGASVFAAGLLLLVVSVAGKLLGVHLAGRILGWPKGEAAVIGWMLQTKALIMIIFANILLDKAIITSASFTALLLMAVGSTLLTMPIVERKLRRLGKS
jgi:Kef-type K+ transport system membrane component KefB